MRYSPQIFKYASALAIHHERFITKAKKVVVSEIHFMHLNYSLRMSYVIYNSSVTSWPTKNTRPYIPLILENRKLVTASDANHFYMKFLVCDYYYLSCQEENWFFLIHSLSIQPIIWQCLKCEILRRNERRLPYLNRPTMCVSEKEKIKQLIHQGLACLSNTIRIKWKKKNKGYVFHDILLWTNRRNR